MAGRQYWSAPVPPLGTASGAAVTGGTSLADGSPQPPIIIPGDFLDLGTEIRIRAHGEYTSTSATPTFTFGFYWGTPGVAIGSALALAVTPAMALSASGSSWPWMAEWDGECRLMSTGAGGNTGQINGQGKFHLGSSLTAFAVPQAMPVTKALRTVSLDTSINKAIMAGVTLSSTTGTPSVTVDDLIVELLG